MERSELTDGDLGIGCMKGDTGELDNPLPRDSFRDSDKNEAPNELA
jgi:hypothetical protein